MTKIGGILIFSLVLYGCGADEPEEDSPTAVQTDGDEWLEYADEEIETGAMLIDLPGDHGSGEGTCILNITRANDQSLASLILTLDVIGEGCDGMGNCDNPDMLGGQLMYSGGIEGDKAFATMILNYEPPSASEEELLWMYNAIYNSEPFSQFDMAVDGEAFNILTSDTRDAEDYSKGPHLWNTKIDIEADMLRSSETDDPSTPGLQTRGKFSYDGVCEVSAKYMQL